MLTTEDWARLDGKFDVTYDKLNRMRDDLTRHVATPCADVVKHVEDCHTDKGLKSITCIGTMVAVILAILAFLKTYIGGH